MRIDNILRFKEGSISSIAKEFNILKEIDTVKEKGFNFVNEINYDEKKINVVEYIEQVEEKDKVVEKRFVFITDIEISKNNVEDIVAAGRSRWKIENEGFNNQKNGTYDLEHVCCKDYNAMKNHYILIQIADILRQLFEKGSEVLKMLKLAKKDISSKLKFSFTRESFKIEDIPTTRMQIRNL